MIYDVRPSVLWVGGKIASFIATTTYTHSTISSPAERESLGLKNPARYSWVSPKSWNEWLPNDSELPKGGVFTGKQGPERSHPAPTRTCLQCRKRQRYTKRRSAPKDPRHVLSYSSYFPIQANHSHWKWWPRREGKDMGPHTLPKHQEVEEVSMGGMCTSKEGKSKQPSFVQVSPVLERTEWQARISFEICIV